MLLLDVFIEFVNCKPKCSYIYSTFMILFNRPVVNAPFKKLPKFSVGDTEALVHSVVLCIIISDVLHFTVFM